MKKVILLFVAVVFIYVYTNATITSETTEGILIKANGHLDVWGTLNVNAIVLKNNLLVNVYQSKHFTG